MYNFKQFNENNSNDIYYHGSDFKNLNLKNIKIDKYSENQFYGSAFYISKDIELAKEYGKYLYKITIDGNFMKLNGQASRMSVGSKLGKPLSQR